MSRLCSAVMMSWLFAGACVEPEPVDEPTLTIEFRVVDSGGGATGAGVRCEYHDSSATGDGGVIDATALGGDEYTCEVPTWATRMTVSTGDSFDGRTSYLVVRLSPQTTRIADLVIWRPQVSIEEVGDQVVVTWDAPPLPPATGWTGAQHLQVDPTIYPIEVPLDTTTASFPLALLEDLPASLQLSGGFTMGSGYEASNPADEQPFEHTPVVPPSRNAECQTLRVSDRGAELDSGGRCRLTDGLRGPIDCFDCEVRGGIVDLGAVVDVYRTSFICTGVAGGTLELSVDGIAYSPVDELVTLSPPIPARYVRATCAGVATEVVVWW